MYWPNGGSRNWGSCRRRHSRSYRDRLDNQVIPTIGHLQVKSLTVGRVDKFLNQVKASNGAAVAKLTKSVMSGLCGLACRHDALRQNPCRDVGKISLKRAKTPLALTIEELRQLRASLAADPVAVAKDLPDLVAFLAATGVRIGESLAVCWAAVDLGAGTVEIRGTVLRVTGQGLIVKPTPKSKAGERVLELPSWCVQLLQSRKRSAVEAFEKGEQSKWRSVGEMPVFVTELGNRRDPTNTMHVLKQAFVRAGFKDITTHNLRKTVATVMDQAGLSARAAADQLGHENPALTQNVYFGRKIRKTGAAAILESIG